MAERPAEQLVFGYRDGHELLASSTHVEHATATELLPHLDASFEDGARHHLVGTSLQTLNRYLLARLWPAPEVDRPGAVWAHALLLNPSELARATSWVMQLRKPSFQALSEFEASPPQTQSAPQPVNERLAVGVAWAALGAPEDRSVIIWERADEADAALVAFLAALPAAARPGFSFRTRGRARLGTARYVLQVASQLSGRPKGPVLRILDLRREFSAEPPVWTKLAIDDMDGAALRGFVHRYGDKEASSRARTASLAQTWAAIRGDDTEAALTALIRGFPSADEVGDLREALLGRVEGRPLAWRVSERERLELLMRHAAHFDLKALNWSDRLQTLWSKEPAAAAGIAADAPEQLRALALETAASGAGPEAIPVLLGQPDVLEAVLSARPSLLEDSTSWPAETPQTVELLLKYVGALDRERLIREIVSNGRRDLAEALVEVGALPVADVVSVVLEPRDSDAVRRAIEVVGRVPFSEWFRTSRLPLATEVAVVKEAPPELLARRGLGRLVPLADALRRAKGPDELLAAAVLFSLALQAPQPAADKILRATFAPLHRAVVEQRLDPRAWERLCPRLPNAGSPDQANRLRGAVAARAKRGRWSNQDLAKMLDGAGPGGEKVVKLLPRKHPFRRFVDAAVGGISDLVK